MWSETEVNRSIGHTHVRTIQLLLTLFILVLGGGDLGMDASVLPARQDTHAVQCVQAS